jgi:hypothetical protein
VATASSIERPKKGRRKTRNKIKVIEVRALTSITHQDDISHHLPSFTFDRVYEVSTHALITTKSVD